MKNSTPLSSFFEKGLQLIEQGKNLEEVKHILQSEIADEKVLADLMHELKRNVNKRRTKSGSLFVLLGVIILGLGFLSCLIMHFCGGDIDLLLYGLTTIGAMFLTIGIVLIFT
jgi:hypothetical protein